MAIYAHQTAVGVFDDDDLADEAVEGLRNARFTILAMLKALLYQASRDVLSLY